MTNWQAVVLGAIQGFTEFLPVSSSGHLVLVDKLLGLKENSLALDVFLHTGTLLAVVSYYFREILALVRRPFSKLGLRLLMSTIPTIIIAVLFEKTFEQIFHSGATLGIEFVITGVLLLYVETRYDQRGIPKERISMSGAFFIGLAQGAAILPALSRSALTLCTALGFGMKRDDAVKYSFLLSVPIVFGATIFEIKDVGHASFTVGNTLWLALAASALTGFLAIWGMTRLIKTMSLRPFGYYTLLLGIFVMFDQMLFHHFF